MKRVAIAVAVVLIAGVAITHWYFSDRGRFTNEPEYAGLDRNVVGNDLLSDHDPAEILRFDPALRYLGGQKFILVYLTDESRQKELMIIFMDDLASRGLTAAELEEGGAEFVRWPEIEQAHLDRIRDTLTVLPGTTGRGIAPQ